VLYWRDGPHYVPHHRLRDRVPSSLVPISNAQGHVDVTREQLQKLIEYAAQRFSKTHYPGEKHEVARLTVKLLEMDSLEVLIRAVALCRVEDPRTPGVHKALTILESRATLNGPSIIP